MMIPGGNTHSTSRTRSRSVLRCAQRYWRSGSLGLIRNNQRYPTDFLFPFPEIGSALPLQMLAATRKTTSRSPPAKKSKSFHHARLDQMRSYRRNRSAD